MEPDPSPDASPGVGISQVGAQIGGAPPGSMIPTDPRLSTDPNPFYPGGLAIREGFGIFFRNIHLFGILLFVASVLSLATDPAIYLWVLDKMGTELDFSLPVAITLIALGSFLSHLFTYIFLTGVVLMTQEFMARKRTSLGTGLRGISNTLKRAMLPLSIMAFVFMAIDLSQIPFALEVNPETGAAPPWTLITFCCGFLLLAIFDFLFLFVTSAAAVHPEKNALKASTEFAGRKNPYGLWIVLAFIRIVTAFIALQFAGITAVSIMGPDGISEPTRALEFGLIITVVVRMGILPLQALPWVIVGVLYIRVHGFGTEEHFAASLGDERPETQIPWDVMPQMAQNPFMAGGIQPGTSPFIGGGATPPMVGGAPSLGSAVGAPSGGVVGVPVAAPQSTTLIPAASPAGTELSRFTCHTCHKPFDIEQKHLPCKSKCPSCQTLLDLGSPPV